jgi:acyl transferase domain-containing protein
MTVVSTSPAARPHSIAVVGVAGLLPGATGVPEFWRHVTAARDLVTDVPATHWLVEDYFDADPAAPDRTYGRRGSFLPPVVFDPMAFGISPKSLPATDTAQLLSLLVAKQVLLDAGVSLVRGEGDAEREKVSVVLGTSALELYHHMGARMERPVWLKALRESGIRNLRPRPSATASPTTTCRGRRTPSPACSAT